MRGDLHRSENGWRERYQARYGTRPPFPGPDWFILAEFEDCMRACRGCGNKHYFQPSSVGYWRESFICTHCDYGSDDDQGVYVGRAFWSYGLANGAWYQRCVACGQYYFNEREPRKVREKTGRSGREMRTVRKLDGWHFCDRCDGSNGKGSLEPADFHRAPGKAWRQGVAPPQRAALPLPKPAVAPRPQRCGRDEELAARGAVPPKPRKLPFEGLSPEERKAKLDELWKEDMSRFSNVISAAKSASEERNENLLKQARKRR